MVVEKRACEQKRGAFPVSVSRWKPAIPPRRARHKRQRAKGCVCSRTNIALQQSVPAVPPGMHAAMDEEEVEVPPVGNDHDVKEVVERQLDAQLAAARLREEAAVIVKRAACPQVHEDALVRRELQPPEVVVETLARDIFCARPLRVVLTVGIHMPHARVRNDRLLRGVAVSDQVRSDT